MRTSVHILNRSPTSSLEGQTPYQAWYGKKPNVKYFRVFGSLAYSHILDEQRKKIDPKSQACIFVGYCENTKSYRLYNPRTRKILISRDLIFDEGGESGKPKIFSDVESQDTSSKQVQQQSP